MAENYLGLSIVLAGKSDTHKLGSKSCSRGHILECGVWREWWSVGVVLMMEMAGVSRGLMMVFLVCSRLVWKEGV